MLLIGEAFVNTSEETATEYCQTKLDVKHSLIIMFTTYLCLNYFNYIFFICQNIQAEQIKLKDEEGDILSRQDILKKELYGRFGDSINLEN